MVASPDGAPGTRPWPRPRVLVSECLGFAAVRYNGQILSNAFVAGLRAYADLIPLCPEVAIGLGVPREPIRLVAREGAVRLVQPATGRDLTEPMIAFARDAVAALGPLDGAVLKSRSPTCGLKDVRVYPEVGPPPEGRKMGLFAAELVRALPELVVEDDGRLTNAALRHHFLVRLFALADLRRVAASGSPAELVAFHSRYKLLLMAVSPEALRALGRRVAATRRAHWEENVSAYRRLFAATLARTPRRPGVVNALQHAFGYVSRRLTAGERTLFDELLAQYRGGRVRLEELLTLLEGWAVRFDESYLLAQRLFHPYPRPLRVLTDSGRR